MIARFSAEEVRQRRGDDHVHTVATCAEEQEIFVYADSIEKGFLLLQRTTNPVFDFLPRVQLQDIGDQNEKMWEIYRDNLKAGHIRSPAPLEDVGAPSCGADGEGGEALRDEGQDLAVGELGGAPSISMLTDVAPASSSQSAPTCR